MPSLGTVSPDGSLAPVTTALCAICEKKISWGSTIGMDDCMMYVLGVFIYTTTACVHSLVVSVFPRIIQRRMTVRFLRCMGWFLQRVEDVGTRP